MSTRSRNHNKGWVEIGRDGKPVKEKCPIVKEKLVFTDVSEGEHKHEGGCEHEEDHEVSAEEEEPFCALCDQLSTEERPFATDHWNEDCFRCSFCRRWQKNGNMEAHRQKCKAYQRELKKEQEHKAAKKAPNKPNKENKKPKERRVVPLCKFWDQGYCRNGDMCRFRHDESPLAPSAKVAAGNIECYNCGEFGHHQKHCDKGCEQCGASDHITMKCIRCFNCGRWGTPTSGTATSAASVRATTTCLCARTSMCAS